MNKPDIEKAKVICRAERRMRDRVFRRDPEKQRRKVEEMNFVIGVLDRCELEIFGEEQSLFEE